MVKPAGGLKKQWTKDELKLAFYLYFQLPFGRLHSKSPEIIELAKILGRTPSSVAMKLVNFASLDPSITGTGRSGLKGASKLDRDVWNEFHDDWEALAEECEGLKKRFARDVVPILSEVESESSAISFIGETRTTTIEQRLRQGFFFGESY